MSNKINVRMAESARLVGTARVDGWRRKFEERWFAPLGDEMMMMWDASLKARGVKEDGEVDLRGSGGNWDGKETESGGLRYASSGDASEEVDISSDDAEYESA